MKKAEDIQKLIFVTSEISLLIFFISESITFYTLPHKKWWGIMLYPPKILSVFPSALRFRTLYDRFSSNFAWTLISGRSGLGLQMG